MKIKNQGVDHFEFVVEDLSARAALIERFGFEKIGERHLPEKGQKTLLYGQGFIRVALTANDGTPEFDESDSGKFLQKHGDGISYVAIEVENARDAFEGAVRGGAAPAMEPKTWETAEGRVTRSEIWTLSDVRYTFIERQGPSDSNKPALFDEGMTARRMESPSLCGLRVVDHITTNVQMGKLEEWTEWYKKVFGFIVTRHFDISTGKTGLLSNVVQSEDGKVKVPINTPTEPESQIQEFVDRFHGAGVQHLALLCTDAIESVSKLRQNGFQFLGVPHSYYEAVPSRVKSFTEDLSELEKLELLIDGEESGYLLQTFTRDLIGPFFFEVIQRKGNQGFGEGNFQALFEAIERDQVQRGALKAGTA